MKYLELVNIGHISSYSAFLSFALLIILHIYLTTLHCIKFVQQSFSCSSYQLKEGHQVKFNFILIFKLIVVSNDLPNQVINTVQTVWWAFESMRLSADIPLNTHFLLLTNISAIMFLTFCHCVPSLFEPIWTITIESNLGK